MTRSVRSSATNQADFYAAVADQMSQHVEALSTLLIELSRRLPAGADVARLSDVRSDVDRLFASVDSVCSDAQELSEQA